MEDIFDKTRDRWQRHFRYPLTLRFLWLLAIGIVVATLVMHARVEEFFEDRPRPKWVAYGVLGFVVLFLLWTSFRAWFTHIIVSPTSIKVAILSQGRRRISWINILEVRCKWRLLGHTLTFIGSDGAQVPFRSSIKGYDDLIRLIRGNVPDHINAQLDDFLGEEQEEEEPEPAPEAQAPPSPEAEPEDTQDEAGPEPPDADD